jgi:hypothetical protein
MFRFVSPVMLMVEFREFNCELLIDSSLLPALYQATRNHQSILFNIYYNIFLNMYFIFSTQETDPVSRELLSFQVVALL